MGPSDKGSRAQLRHTQEGRVRLWGMLGGGCSGGHWTNGSRLGQRVLNSSCGQGHLSDSTVVTETI